jgi:HlyD family secretion protein
MQQPTLSDRVETPRRRAMVLWTALALAIALAAVLVWWWRGHNQPLRYVTARVTQGDIQRAVNMTGALNPVVTAQVESFVSGNIKSWSCDFNTPVKVGQVCALIDPLPFQVIVDQDTAALHSAMAQMAKDRVAAANQAVIYAYDQKLIDQGIVSQETINADKATLDQDQAQVKLDIASIAQQRASLHGAQVNLGYTQIHSPVDGMVITRYIDVGQTVVSSLSASPLFLIGKDMHFMQVDTNVSEALSRHDGRRAHHHSRAHQRAASPAACDPLQSRRTQPYRALGRSGPRRRREPRFRRESGRIRRRAARAGCRHWGRSRCRPIGGTRRARAALAAS